MALLQKCVAIAAGRMPKVISPQSHAVIDYLIAGSFFMAAALCWRRSKRAAISSLICGGITTANNALTDYPGGIWKVMSFQAHGKLDVGVAALTASMPGLMDFADESESQFFALQSMVATTVTAMTDFDYCENPASDQTGKRRDEEQIA